MQGDKKMGNYKWANFLTGSFGGGLIRIDTAKDLKTLHRLITKNKLCYYKYFIKRGYRENLQALYNNTRNKLDFYKFTRNGKSFLVEYNFGKGFTIALLNEYDSIRQDESEFEIYSMEEIIQEIGE